MKRLFYYWLPVLIWMIFIFSLSSQSKIAIGRTYWQDVIIKKTLHMVEYAVLYFLLFRAFFTSKLKSLTKKDRYVFPFLISVLYAVLDEIHQTYVPTREGVIRDVAIDTVGMALMYLYLRNGIHNLKRLI